ncbi:MAG: hypothetical protein ACK5B9_10985 [Flavobacteriia bacterium]|jgi:hypothetical protein
MKHILIINPNKDTFSNPTIVSILEILVKNNEFKITILSPEQLIQKPKQFESINEIVLPELSVNWGKKIQSWFPKLNFILKLNKFCKTEKVSTIISVDPIGLILGGRIKSRNRAIKFHYFSFEIFFRSELIGNSYFLKLKKKEIKYSKLIDCLLIQDEVRARLLIEENQLQNKPFKQFLIPVAPNFNKITGENRIFWRNKLGISDNQTVLLHSGSLEKWSGGDILIEVLQNGLAENQLLVVHSKSELDVENPIHAKLLAFEQAGFPIMIHKTVFSDYKEYLSFLQLADYALVLYANDCSSPYTGTNIKEIGLASGKLSCFLSQEIPIICTWSEIYDKLNKKYDFGYVLNEGAILKLENFPDSSSKNDGAKRLFEEVFNVDLKVNEYIHFLKNEI